MKKVMVTGATGFLGSHVVRSLLRLDVSVLAVKRTSSSTLRLADVEKLLHWVDMDLMKPASVKKAVEENSPHIIIHCAAYGVDYDEQDRQLMFAVNVAGSMSLLEVAINEDVERFIHIGSCFEYGDKEHAIRENELLESTDIYGASKAAASTLILNFAKQCGIEAAVMRPFGLWGPHEETYRLVPQIINACSLKKNLDLTGCMQVRDYTFAPDMAEIIVAITLLEKFPNNEIVNLGTGRPICLRDFVMTIAKELKGKTYMQFGKLPYRSTEMFSLIADTSKQQSLIGGFKFTSVSDGLKKYM